MADNRLEGIRACVFDAYGTLFDVNSAAERSRARLGEQWLPLADLWRTKQLQYTWLRAVTGRHADFWEVTGDALDFSMESLGLNDGELRSSLMDLYLHLDAYPEVEDTLRRLRGAGLATAILSNGSPRMLSEAVDHAGLRELLDPLLSVEEVGVFKPAPAVYQLAVDRLGAAPGEICFLSSNGWDAYSAKAFGFRVLWCNRFGQRPERIPDTPDGEILRLDELPGRLGLA